MSTANTFRTVFGQLHQNGAIPLGAKSCQGVERIEKNLAPQVGLEPTTLRLTAECSTIELLRSGSERSAFLLKQTVP